VTISDTMKNMKSMKIFMAHDLHVVLMNAAGSVQRPTLRGTMKWSRTAVHPVA